MGAMAVNANIGDETVVPVRAEIVTVHNLHATPIDFGRIAVDDRGLEEGEIMVVKIDSAGIVTYDEDQGVPGYILSNGKKGVVTGTDCEHLSFNEVVTMSIPSPGALANSYSNVFCITDNGDATFYGYFTVDPNNSLIPAGNYTGSLTVTEINPEP